MKILSYFASFTISLLGNSIANVVLPVLILVATQEVLLAGAVALVSGISTFLFGLVSGPLIDRYDRRFIACVGDWISALSIGILATVGTFGTLSPTWFLVCAFLSGAGDMPAWNAREAMIYSVQRESKQSLDALVGLRETVSALAIILGPTSAGLLMNYFDARTVLWVTAATSLTAGVLCLFGPKGSVETKDSANNKANLAYWSSFTEGISFLFNRERTVLRKLTYLNVASVALVSVLQALVIPVVMTLSGNGDSNGYALASIGVGLLVGGIAYAALGSKIPVWPLTVGAALANIIGLALLVQFQSVPYTLVMCFVFGLTSAGVGAVTGVVSLRITPEFMRGRVNGLQNSIAMVVGPIAIFATALVISRTSVGVAGWGLVVFWILVNAMILLSTEVRNSVKESRSES